MPEGGTWEYRLTPRDWQERAFSKWRQERGGIVEVVTGGGKTAFAQMCIAEFFRVSPEGQVLIVVPTLSLLDQWWVALQDELGALPEDIGLLSGQEKCEGNEAIVIAVINSARNATRDLASNRDLFLIVDECHRAGSPENAKALRGNFAATLGLSATPRRDYDAGFELLVRPRLGPVIHEYTYLEAARDGVISPFALTNVRVDLLPDEDDKYRRFSRSIARIARRPREPGDDEVLSRLLQRRAAVASNATMRIPVAVRLVELHVRERTVVFHERIDAANRIVMNLRTRGHRATIYHAKIGPTVRRDNLRLFRRGQFDVLVCCRALDEGMNVPEASVAVVASSTASRRQRIQRLGRILRAADGKHSAHVYTIFATDEEERRLRTEEAALDGVTSVSWKETSLD